MKQLSIKSGDSIVVDGWDKDVVLKVDRIDGGSAELSVNAPEDVSVKRGKKQKLEPKPEPRPNTDVQGDLKNITENVIALLSEMDATASQEVLSQLVSDLFYAQAKKRQKEERLVKQAEGIAAAKARGVQFGARRKPLPENFEEYCEAWRDGQMSLREAAKACGMSHSSFYQAVGRAKNSV